MGNRISGHSRHIRSAPAWRADFSTFWIASVLGYFASWVTKFVLPLFATRATSSPALVAGVTFALTAPWLLCSLQAGALVDRLDRRRILLGVAALRIGTAGALALAVMVGVVTLLVLYGAALLLGIVETFTETTITSVTPMIVPEGQLESANARLVGTAVTIEMIALPLGGALAAIGLGLAVGFSTLCAAAALLVLLLLRGQFRPARAARRWMGTEIVEGMRYLWSHASLRVIGIMAAVINGCWTAWAAVFVLYAVAPGPMRLTTFAYGIVLTASAVGGLLGTLLTVPVQRRFGRRWLIGINIVGNSIGFIAPAFTPNAWIIGGALIVGGIGGPMWGIAAVSLIQRSVPDALRGRVYSAYRFVGFGTLPLGSALGGIVAQVFGIRAVFLISGALTMLMLVPFFRVISERAMASSAAALSTETSSR